MDGKAYIEKLKNEYIKSHLIEQERDALIAENNIERRDVRGYHGREILELLQNADDAYQKSIDLNQQPPCDLEVTISYKSNVLTVTNTGTFFDKDGIKAIVQGNNSPKSGKYIGSKGTGFRSVLNWANTVRIFSGGFAVEFSKAIAQKVFESIKNEPQIVKQRNKDANLYIPMLAVPENIPISKTSDVTTIEIEVDPEKTKDDFSVLKQLEEIDLRILLFLPNTSKIHIITDDSEIIYQRNTITTSEIKEYQLQKHVDGMEVTKESFYVYKTCLPKAIKEDEEDKDILLSVAVPIDYDVFQPGNLYSFFPLLNAESPFNCILHATYLLDDHRNAINLNESNKTIIKEQINFLFNIANEFASLGKNEIAHKLLTPINFVKNNGKFQSSFSRFGLEEYFLEKLATMSVFQTVNGDNIAFNDGPKIIKGDYPKEVFVGEPFGKLLKPLNHDTVLLLEWLSNKKGTHIYYSENELCSTINKETNSWDPSRQVDVFIWWNLYWKDHDTFHANSVPNLLKTQQGNWLSFKSECYFLVGDMDDIKLPSWVQVPALLNEYQDILIQKSEELPEIKMAKEADKDSQTQRLISQRDIYPTINFAYRDRNTIISAVNSSVNSYKDAKDFVKWLWDNFRNDPNWKPPTNNYNFPSKNDNSFKDSKKIFLGSDYNNPLAEKLFDSSYGRFPSILDLTIAENEKEKFVEFVQKFGVKKFPSIEIQKIVKPIISFQEKYKKKIRLSGNLGASYSADYEYSLPYINNLENILKTLPSKEIIEWIVKDNDLYTCLSNPLASNAHISYRGNRQSYMRPYQGAIDNYIREVFNESEWVEINGQRYAPRQILQNFNSKSNQAFAELTPVLTMDIIELLAKELSFDVEKICDVFNKFAFCDKVTDLNSDRFYEIMLKLPTMEFHQSEKLSKSIYRIIEQPSFSNTYKDSGNKTKYFTEGKLLVKYKGQIQYYHARDSYLPSPRIIIKKDVPIVEKGQRTNNVNFKNVFGCQEYTKEYSIQKDRISISEADTSFQLYFEEFRKYTYPFRERNENIEKYGGNLKITLVSEIFVEESGLQNRIDDEYMLIRDSVTNWYITVFSPSFNHNTISEIIENIYTNVANTPGFDAGKIGELFRAKDKADKEFLIIKEFGVLSVIEDAFFKNDLKTNFYNTVYRITDNQGFDIDRFNIDFDDFHNIQNAQKIITLFKQISTDIEHFKNSGFVYHIDLIPYYKRQLSEFIHKEQRHFEDVLFEKALDDKALQDSFIKTFKDFIQFEIKNYENSIAFDVKEKLIQQFGRWDDIETTLSASDAYKKNYSIMNPENLFKDEISDNDTVQTMIFFKREDEFQKWLEDSKAKIEEQKKKQNDDIYAKYRDIVPRKVEITYHEKAKTEHDNGESGHHGHAGVVTTTKIERRQTNQKIMGNKGELFIYNLLCKKMGQERVHPRSEAFVEMDILTPEQAVSGGYDLSYTDENGQEIYVEVKTGDERSFTITPNELRFAKDNPDKYKVFLVFKVDDDEPNYIELPMRFWENEKFRKHEIVEKIEFEF